MRVLRLPVLALFLAAASVHAPAGVKVSTIQTPPMKRGDCHWVHGRSVVANGSMVQRIWIIGTNRVVAMRDDEQSVPTAILAYEEAAFSDRTRDFLFGDFRICALEDSRAGWMRLVRVMDVRNPIVGGKPFHVPRRQDIKLRPGEQTL
jgi:hypothetical protein